MASLSSPPSTGSSAPQSVEKISRLAQDYKFDPAVPLRYWLRTAATLVREARIYLREGHDEQAYLLLFRHAQLVLVHLADHPDLKDGKDVKEERKALVGAEKEVKQNLEILEKLKPRINKRYERYTQLMRERQHRMSSATASPAVSTQPPSASDPALSGVAEPLEAGKDSELAVKLARTEISRRATARNAMRHGQSGGDESSRRAAGIWGDWEEALQRNEGREPDDLSRRIQEVRLNLENGPQARSRPAKSATRPSTEIPSTSAYKYPTVPRQKSFDITSPAGIPRPMPEKPTKPPILPPKESYGSLDGPPPRPDKLSAESLSELAPAVPAKVTPDERRKGLDPSSFTFKPSAYLENGTPLRTVFLPPHLRTHFLSLAASNTRKNLETCGVLCGTLISNALFISRLLIPEQVSTSDTCETVNESAIFDYCDSEDLMVLGWIHTHPTQTCFMSSRDLHTHCGYQVMLPESIAIVCAPSQTPDWGVFRLTDPPGLKSVLSCTQTGLFHPHAETNLYTDALRPGHVFEANGLEFETIDQRVKQ
ncbi:Putative SMAD6 interacting protein AMSH [Aspergillus calidoustus]|uniref:Putative SMAD6 interacting protein AMSH n=1 Tax=Aspergillus calidoustus TaxID=454130 RepID=A0A0U4ZC05_ASPCI|nr:Putative SMAD6 interacting protein AMSH [Aspergillus calidoustus]